MLIEVRKGSYKGHPTLSIVKFDPETGKEYNVLTFGLKKARLLVENIEEIRSFISAAEQAGHREEAANA